MVVVMPFPKRAAKEHCVQTLRMPQQCIRKTDGAARTPRPGPRTVAVEDAVAKELGRYFIENCAWAQKEEPN